ncbi:MAG: heme lyase CcmF/NrfE family subunit [Granulosicoccaceae bacterium]
MIPEIGHFALVLALSVTVVQAVIPLWGSLSGRANWVALAPTAAQLQALLVALSYGCLTYSFIVHDFSVLYVANTSNTELPLIYRISGVWGAHEGSLLLWALILSVWTFAVSIFSRGIPSVMLARVLSVMAMISVGFLLFILLTSNPFERIFPVPAEGRDLNPLLQDFGLAVHPPMLYMGYVGFAVAFAFAIAALIGGRLDMAWARWMRPWTALAWAFLTIGIALGSWWAYYELGWGGWWFWDPVENASFMPWLVGTALMHSLAASEKRGVFKAWTVLLAVFAFSLSLLGTFLVRSGVLTSVHAFASDPERGVFILGFLVATIGCSLLLYAWRAPRLTRSGGFAPVSRESGLLLNNVLLVVFCATVLLGTLYPLVLDALDMGKISVGPPYFNTVLIPLGVPMAFAMGIGSLARWKGDDLGRGLALAAIASLLAGAIVPWLMGGYYWGAVLGSALGVWVMATTLQGLFDRFKNKGFSVAAMQQVPASFYGMLLAHAGIGVFIIGVTLTSHYNVEKDLRMAPGDVFEVSGYSFTFQGVTEEEGPNYDAFVGVVNVESGGQAIAQLRSEKRRYRVQTMPMTEAAIDPGLFRDLYVALGEQIGDDGAWAVRIYYKPFVRWIWLGCLMMGFGGLFTVFDRRYKLASTRVLRAKSAPVQEAPA